MYIPYLMKYTVSILSLLSIYTYIHIHTYIYIYICIYTQLTRATLCTRYARSLAFNPFCPTDAIYGVITFNDNLRHTKSLIPDIKG